MNGYEFNRQFPICQYTVSFICRKLNLIVEIDHTHELTRSVSENKKLDDLGMLGYEILVFTEDEVVNQFDEVAGRIIYMVELLDRRARQLPV